MTKKQKKMLYRIIVTFLLFAVLMVCEHTGRMDGWNKIVLFVIYLVPYCLLYTSDLEVCYEKARFSFDSAYRAMKRLVEKYPDLTAVFAMSDVMGVNFRIKEEKRILILSLSILLKPLM